MKADGRGPSNELRDYHVSDRRWFDENRKNTNITQYIDWSFYHSLVEGDTKWIKYE